jgi:hypothetical protein
MEVALPELLKVKRSLHAVRHLAALPLHGNLHHGKSDL